MKGFWLLVTIVIIVSIFTVKEKSQKIFLIIALIVYLPVSLYLNDNVRKASTHGNTKHGWYSKYNGSEKSIASTWFLVFPLGVTILYFKVFGKKDENDILESKPRDNSLSKSEVKNDILMHNKQSPEVDNSEVIYCPKCNSLMVKRLAKKGKYSGMYFYGCSKFPKCKGIKSYL